MEFRQLGRGGPDVSAIGLGAWPFGGAMGHVEEQAAITTTRAAIDAGVTLVDTAQSYLASQGFLGKALQDGYRERCFLCTKVSNDFSPQAIYAAMEESLRMLRVDRVDLYQIHSWNPTYPIDESMEAMARLQEQGKTRYIGVSNFDAEQMAQAGQTALVNSNQPRYNLLDRRIEAEDLPYCQLHGIGNLIHSPLGQGLLTGRYRPGHQFAASDRRSQNASFQGESFEQIVAVADRLQEVAADRGLSLIQLAISWVLRQKAVSCVLVGAKSPQQFQEHLGAVGVELTEEELTRIETILEDAPAGV